MRELNITEIQIVDGGNAAAVLGGLIAFGTYLGGLNAMGNFGLGLGYGIYDATH